MTQQTKNTLLVLAIVAGAVSLPLTWMTIRGAQVEGGLGEMFGGMTFHVTGLNGYVTFLIKVPIWAIVGLAALASSLQLMNSSAMFAVPRAAEWFVALLALAWIVIALGVALISGQAALKIGSALGFFCALVPVICLASPTPSHVTNKPVG